MQIFKNTFIISFFTILSQLLGVLRDKLLVSVVGVGVVLDMYNASFKIPDLMASILFSFVGLTVMVPFLNSSLVKGDIREMHKKFSTIFFFFNIVMVALAILVVFTLDLFLHKLFPAFDTENLKTLSHITKLMLLQPIILGMSNLLACIAQAYKNFLYFALAPVLYNIGLIVGIVYFYEAHGSLGLLYGVWIGAFMHLFINFIFIFKNKVDINMVYFDFKYIKQILPIVTWRSVAFVLISLKQFILTIVSGLMGLGIISVWTFALNLTNMCVQFFATSYAVASFPVLSEYYEKGEYEILKKTIRKHTSQIFLFSLIFMCVAYVFAKPIVDIIYGGNEKVLRIFYVLIIAIPFLNLEQYYARAMMAMRRVKFISIVHIFSFAVLIVALFVFYKMDYDYIFLAYAYLISVIAQVSVLFFMGNRIIK